jgi:HSP20 family protein
MVEKKNSRKLAARKNEINPWKALEDIDDILNPFTLPYFPDFGNEMEVPDVDIADNGTSLEIKTNIAGVNKKDINIKMSKNTLTITANKNEEKESKKKNYYLKETSSAGYYRKLSLPENVKPDTAKTAYENGVLTITVDKETPTEEKEIKLE